MEIKVTVTIEAGQSLANLISMLQPLEVYAPSKETLEAIEEMDKIQEEVKKVEKPKAKKEPKVEAPKEDVVIDYEMIRTQIKKLGAEKRAAGKEIAPIFKRYGAGKLSQIDNENLSAVLEEIKAL